MSTNRFELSVNSKNLYKELRGLIYTQYLKKDYIGDLRLEHSSFIVYYLHSHSSTVHELKSNAPVVQRAYIDGGLMDFDFIDIPTQTVRLKTSDSLNTAFLEVRTQN